MYLHSQKVFQDLKNTLLLFYPTAYYLIYDIFLDDIEQKTIKADDPLDIGVFLILKKKDTTDTSQLGANIGGPLVINVHEQLGLQKVLKRQSAVTEH